MEEINLLQVLKAKTKERTSRVLILCSINVDEAHNMNLENLMQDWVNEQEQKNITGLLLQVSSYAIDLLEAETSLILNHFKFLESLSLIIRANVIAWTEDAPSRYY